jgi:hypothetical protein
MGLFLLNTLAAKHGPIAAKGVLSFDTCIRFHVFESCGSGLMGTNPAKDRLDSRIRIFFCSIFFGEAFLIHWFGHVGEGKLLFVLPFHHELV